MQTFALRAPSACARASRASPKLGPSRRPARVAGGRAPSLAVCASNQSHSASHSDSDSIVPEDPWEELGLAPGASQEAVAAAFRATILRCHPDLHGNAPWAVAKTHRTLKAVEMLRGSRSGAGPDSAWNRSPGSRRAAAAAPGPFLKRGPNISFYPNTSAFDYWAAYGEREPTPEEARRFKEDWEAAKTVAEERLREQQAARSASALPPEVGAQAMPVMAAAVAVAFIAAQVLFVGVSDANNGQPKGAAANGDCLARGGGFCRFM